MIQVAGPQFIQPLGFVANKSGTNTRTLTKYLTGTLGSGTSTSVAHGISTPDTNIMEVIVFCKNTGNLWCSSNYGGDVIGATLVTDLYFTYDATNVIVTYGTAFASRSYKIIIKYFG